MSALSKYGVPNHLYTLFKDSPQERATFEAFGRFIASFARAESEVHILARHFTKTDDERARLVFKGLRLTDVIDRLRALVRVSTKSNALLFPTAELDEEAAKDIECCLDQLILINDQRSKLVHRVSTYQNEGFAVTNLFTAASFLNVEDDVITLDQIRDMTIDCGTIFLRLSEVTPRVGAANVPAGALFPWQYKRPKQASQRQKPQKARKLRKRQRSASPA